MTTLDRWARLPANGATSLHAHLDLLFPDSLLGQNSAHEDACPLRTVDLKINVVVLKATPPGVDLRGQGAQVEAAAFGGAPTVNGDRIRHR